MSQLYLGMYELGGAYNGYNNVVLVSARNKDDAMYFVGRHAVKEFEGVQKNKGISYDIEEFNGDVRDTLRFKTRLTDKGRRLAVLYQETGEIELSN